VLDRHWRKEKGNNNYGVVFLTSMSKSTIDFASNQIVKNKIKQGMDE
jgi:hypothetical protein